MNDFWDEQFSRPGFKYGTEPNAFLGEQAARLCPRSVVLVPGDGEGRNGVWLAEEGHDVTTVDSSAVGIAKIQALAKLRHVNVATIHADLLEWSPPEGSFDAVVLVYVHFPPDIRGEVHQRLLGGLRKGGLLILEAFHPSQIGRASGGPKDVAMLFTLAMLRTDLASVAGVTFAELFGAESEVLLDEGPGHQGAAMVTRLVAQRVA